MGDRYDWVILGGTPEGRQAAARAARSQFRVALIEPRDRHQAATAQVAAQTCLAWINRPGGRVATAGDHSDLEGSGVDNSDLEGSGLEALKARVLHYTAATFGDEGLNRLTMLGVDVIPEAIAAISTPIAPPLRRRLPLQIHTTTRYLAADRLLLATGCEPEQPESLGSRILGLDQVPYWTPERLITRDRPWPQRWVVLSAEDPVGGDAALALAWALALAQCGRSVRLMLPHPHPLPQFERALNGWAIAQLEAAGVIVDVARLDLDGGDWAGDDGDRHGWETSDPSDPSDPSHPATSDPHDPSNDPGNPFAAPIDFVIPTQQVQQIGETIWVQTGAQAVEADALLVVGGDRPWLPADLRPLLQLPRGQYSSPARSLPITPHLRTRHPQIYACGSVLGGSPDPALAQQEVAIAMAQTPPAQPFWRSPRRCPPPATIQYAHHPITVPLDPPLARVGLSRSQAIAHFGSAAVQHHSLQHGARAMHLLTHRDGRLLGVAAIGHGAIAWIACVASVVQRGGTVDEVRSLPLATGWPNPEGDWAGAIAFQQLLV